MKKVIILHGKARAGKDSFFDMIKEEGISCEKVSFAAPMKKIATEFFDCTLEELELIKDQEHELGCSPRRFLQRLGDIGKELCGTNVWTKKAILAIAESESDLIVITDCRFENELKLVKQVFETLAVHIIRTDGKTNNVPSHCSENGLDPKLFDKTLYNNRVREEYKKQVLSVVKEIL